MSFSLIIWKHFRTPKKWLRLEKIFRNFKLVKIFKHLVFNNVKDFGGSLFEDRNI